MEGRLGNDWNSVETIKVERVKIREKLRMTNSYYGSVGTKGKEISFVISY
jgi:hypothetical protein